MIFTLLMIAGLGNGIAQTPSVGDYQTVHTGDWSNLANWERFNGATWQAPSVLQGYPGQYAGTDDVTIQDGHTITIDVSPAQSIARLFVGEGTSGILLYGTAAACSLKVSGIITIGKGADFSSAPTGTITSHRLLVEGGIINNGTINFSTNDNRSGVGITFMGASSASFDCSGATLTNLRQTNGLVLDKGTSSENVLWFTPGGTFQVLSGNTYGFLNILNGTFRLSGTNQFSNPVFSIASDTIFINGGFVLDNPRATIVGQYGTIRNRGRLTINNGTFNVGTGSGNCSVTNSSGIFTMTGGTMNISGRFTISGGDCVISGGNINIATVGHADADAGAFHISQSADLTMSGNPLITFTNKNSNITPYNDIEIINGTGIKTITGGTFQMGTNATPANTTFLVNSDIPLHNLTVYKNTCKVSLTDHLTINNQLTLNGQLLLNNNNLTMGASAFAISGTLGSNDGMIVCNNGATGGEVRKIYSGESAYTFPLGDNNGSPEYSPLTLNFTSGTFGSGAYAGVKVVNAKHPFNTSSTNYLNRYWNINTNGISDPTYNVNASYLQADVVGSDENISMGLNSSPWTRYGAVNSVTKELSAVGVTQTGSSIGFSGLMLAAATCNITGPTSVCAGQTYTYTVETDGIAPTYSWEFINNTSGATFAGGTTSPTVTVNPVGAGSYQLRVTIIANDGPTPCTSSEVIVNPLPTLVSSGANVNCFGDNNGMITATASNGTAPYSYVIAGPTVNTTGAVTGEFTGLTAGTYTLTVTDANGCTATTTHTITQPAILTATGVQASAVSCFGGSNGTATVTASGGTAPYTITPEQTGLSAGTHTYTVTDANNCTTTVAVTITQPTALTATGIQARAVSCFGGNDGIATITPSGGTAPYNITPAQTGLSAGTHTFTVTDANNCTTTVAVTIIQPTALTATGIQARAVSCFGGNDGAATITPSGGTAPYTVTPLQTGLTAGTTSFTVRDANNCATTVDVLITQPTLLTVTNTSNSPQCQGSTLNFYSNPSGGTTGYRYSWTGPNGFTSNLQNPTRSNVRTTDAGTYTVTITDANGCEATASTSVVINPAPTVSITANPGGTICSGTNVTFTVRVTNAGSNPTYQWQIDGIDVPNETNSTFSSTTLANAQQVTVVVTADPTYCSSTATSNVITMTVNSPVIPTVSVLESRNNICEGTTVNFSAIATNGGNSPIYQWFINGVNVPNVTGSSFSSSNLNNGDQIRVIVTSNATCVSPSTAQSSPITMLVNPVLTPSVSIAANPSTPVCPGTPVTFTASPNNGGSNPTYQWQVNGSPVGSNSATFTSSTLTDGDVVRVRMTSNAACVSPTFAISNEIIQMVNPGAPAIPGAIAGNALVCPNGSQTYSIALVPNATSYQWTVPAGWSINGPSNTETITVTSGASGQNGSITVTASNSCGTSGTRTLAVSVGTLSTAPTGITIANNNTCFGTVKTLSVTGGSLGTGASWEWFTGACGGTPAGTGATLTVNPASTTIYYVRATGTCNTTPCASETVIVSPGAPVQPEAINGTTPVCPASSLTYSIPAVVNATSYNWTVPTGWTIASGQGTTSITVTSGTAGQNGNISVTAGNSCGTSTASSLAVMVSPGAPATPGAIAGVSDQCINSSGLVFSVAPVANATSYTWTVPTGWIITGGVGTNSITVSTNGTASSGNITVIANNSCGSSASSVMAVNIVTSIPNTPEAITGLEVICPSKSTIYSINPVQGATGYTWTVPTGWNIISGQGTTSINVDVLITSSSGSVSVTANNACGNSPARTHNVTVSSSTSVYAGPDVVVCYGTAFINLEGAIQGLNSHSQWDWVLPSGGSVANDRSLSTRYNFPNGNTTTGTLRVQISTDRTVVGCDPILDEMIITIMPIPTANAGADQTICVGSTVSLSGAIGGGASSGSWSGGTGTYSPNANSLNAIYTPSPAELAAGSVTLTLTTNDPVGTCVAVSDQVSITINSQPIVNAGVDQTICTGSLVQLAGSISGNVISGTWSGGTGSFSNPATLNAVYTPSAAEIAAGTITLTLTSIDPVGPCNAVSDQVTITINPVASVNAGSDQIICANGTVLLNGSVGGAATSGTWSGGTGTFSNPTTLNAVFTPSASEIATGTVTLTLTTNDPIGPCNAVTDQVTIILNPLPTVNAGADQTICASSPVTLTGVVSGPVASGTWSGGSGSFSNAASLNTVYTPSAEEIADGTVTLTLTSADPDGPCATVSDQVTITITPTATVNAGVDQSICEGDVLNLRGTMGGAATAVTWSGGAGSFSNPNSINTTYTPAATKTGIVVLTLTTNDPVGSCDPVSDQMQVTIYPRATVNAGINQTICSNGTAQMSASVGGSATSGAWTTSGGGTFSEPASPTAVYTPGNSDIFNGTVTLTYTTNDPEGPCGAVSASITLTISDAIQITSQPSNTGVCATYPADLAVQAVGDNLTYQWYRGTAPGGTPVVNSANITGAQSATLHFNNATSIDEGSYYVVISGAADCTPVTSTEVTLNVDQEITITSQFQSNTVCYGDDFTFSIVAEPGGLLTFQWRKDGVNIPNATGNTLTLNNVTMADGAVYDVLIAGMAGYTCSNAQSAPAALTVTPGVETPVFASGATSTRCQGAGNVTYSATANHSTGITYSLDAASLAGGNTINASTGAVSFAAGWSGSTTITASAEGCNGPATATHTVTITPTVTIAPFAALTSTRCQGAETITYSTTANHSTGLTYSLDNASLAGGNTINTSTGAVSFVATWSGATTITASAAGCNGPVTATHTVTITPTVTIAPFTALTSTRCQGAGTVTYSTTATNSTGITYNLDAASLDGGNTINSSTGAVTFAANWTGPVTITASAAGCNGPATATHTVTVNPTVTIAPYANLTSTRCQRAETITYSTTAVNSTGITYSLDATTAAFAGNSINASTGAVTYAAGWSGTTTITASAAGCNGPVTTTHTVTVTPSVTIAPFSPLTTTRCQGAGTGTYATTASNNSSAIVYSLDAATAAFSGNSINSSTGEVTFAAGWSGTTTITATAAGCNGPVAATHTVTVTPTVTIAPFAASTSSRCQGTGTATYSTTATNSTGITYSLDAASQAGGNTISPSTGTITFAAGWSGNTIITATATGCNGTAIATHTVITDPTSVGGALSPTTQTVCTTTNSGSLSLSGYTGIILRWESSTNAGITWSTIPNTSTSTTHNFTNLPLTTMFRVVVQSGNCPIAYSAIARVVVIPLYTPVISTTTSDLCAGGSTTLTALTGGVLQPIGAFTGGSFNQANPEGWRVTENGVFVGLPANADNTSTGPWSETNGPRTFNGVVYDTQDNTKFAIARGVVRTTMETPVFNLFGLPSAALTFSQAYNLVQGTTARVELSTDGGNTYNIILATYTGSTGGNINNPVNLDMSNYIGMTNLRIRFNYASTSASGWAVEGISIPSQQSDVTYTWSPTESLNPPDGSVVTATPGTTTTYTLTMNISGCPAIATAVVVNVDNPPTVQTTNACIGGGTVTFIQTGGTEGGTWSVSGGGSIVPTTGVFTPTTPGCFTATYTTGNGACSDTKSFVVFPSAPTPVVNTGCGPIVLTPPAAIPGFTLQYSFDDGGTWGGNTPPTADNCIGYNIRTRYLTTLSCGTNVETTSNITGCAMSPAVTRVVDRTPPVITCPPTAYGTTNLNECYSINVVLGTPIVTDNCTEAASITITNNAPAQYPVGNTTVTWTATDGCGNQSTCTQTVSVTDNNQAPVITSCPVNQEQTALAGNCALSNVVIPNPLFTDNCAVTRLTWTMRGATIQDSPIDGINYVSGQTFNVGVTTVTYTAYDAAGNPSAPCSFNVWIKDLNKPVFTVACPENVTRDVDPGLCTAAITVPVPAVTDPCNESFTLINSFNGTNNASDNYPVGTTTVIWTITDNSGNTTTCEQTVTVIDRLPILTCPQNVAEEIAADGCTKSDVTVGVPTFTGNCAAPNLTYTLTGATTGSGSGIVPSTQPYGVGVTTVTYTVTDAHNNTNFCSFTVTIRRLSIPPAVINCPVSPAPVNAVAGTCSAPVTVATPIEVDPCATVTYTFTNDFNNSDNASGSYPVGTTIVTWTISDNSGNTTTCQQTVTVIDNQNPVIICPASPAGICADSNGTYLHNGTTWNATASDDCQAISSLTYTLSGATTGTGTSLNGVTFNSGTTLVTWTATDAAGNTRTCTYNVVVHPLPITSNIYHN